MMAEPSLAAEVGARFDHVLVDEYQDTNRLQASILRAMKADGRGLTVVGDDAQSIYSFRAATVRNILDFPHQFTLPARVVTLERNYRSTQPILDASNAVIGLASERFAKNLWTDRTSSEKPQLVTVRDEVDQARCVAERILEYREAGIALKSQAVLFRSSSHSAQLELELTRRDIPFVKFGGLKFLEAAHIKDVLSRAALGREPAQPDGGFPRRAPAAGRRPGDSREAARRDGPGAGSDGRHGRRSIAPPAAAEDWRALVRSFGLLRGGSARTGPPTWTSSRAGTSRSCSESTRTRTSARATSRSCSRSRRPTARASAS